jgi:hypothetical protein
MRARIAPLLLPTVVVVGLIVGIAGAVSCGSSTPVDMWFNTDAGAAFDAPAREVHPLDAESEAGQGGGGEGGAGATGGAGAAGAGGDTTGAAGAGGDVGGAAGVGAGGAAGA